MIALQFLFWVSVLLTIYIYFGYPCLVYSLGISNYRDRGRCECDEPDGSLPTVTVVIAAFNEEASIRETLENKLSQNYPSELLDIIIVSDESSDRTDDIVGEFGSRVRLIRQQPRAGKTSGLNLAMKAVTSDVVVFSDANSIYAEDAIRALVKCFENPKVGYVTGKMVYVDEHGSLIGDGCSAYMKYENALRKWESMVGNVIGVDGGIDAIRRSLFTPMRKDQLPDFVLPLTVAQSGYTVTYQPNAILREESLTSDSDEYRMRVRVSLRALWALWDLRELMNPWRYGFLSIQLISHKLLRYLAFVPLILIWISSAMLASNSQFFMAVLTLQTLGYVVLFAAYQFPRLRSFSVFGYPIYFVLLNLASMHAFVKFLMGQKLVIWAPRVG